MEGEVERDRLVRGVDRRRDRKGCLSNKLLGSTVVSPYVGRPENKMAATMQVLAFKRR